MKLLHYVLVIVLIVYAAWLTDARLDRQEQRTAELEAYIAQQFAYADTILAHYDGDLDLAWGRIAQQAQSAHTITTMWMSKNPWREEMREHARATNYNLGYIQFLHAKVGSLEAMLESLEPSDW